jgi:hypothetical protein
MIASFCIGPGSISSATWQAALNGSDLAKTKATRAIRRSFHFAGGLLTHPFQRGCRFMGRPLHGQISQQPIASFVVPGHQQLSKEVSRKSPAGSWRTKSSVSRGFGSTEVPDFAAQVIRAFSPCLARFMTLRVFSLHPQPSFVRDDKSIEVRGNIALPRLKPQNPHDSECPRAWRR